MPDFDETETLEVTDEQLDTLRELGVPESELEDMSYADAEEWIARLRAQRENAGRIGSD